MIGILLAAGKGTRLKSDQAKVLVQINGEPMLFAPFKALLEHCEKVLVVVGHQAEKVQTAITEEFREKGRFEFVLQKKALGTGDAVKSAIKAIGTELDSVKSIVVLNGDLPLVRGDLLQEFLGRCKNENLDSACVSVKTPENQGLGRIVRDYVGGFSSICEEADADEEIKKIQEVNAGIYYFKADLLSDGIDALSSSNKQNEFYLTDLLGTAKHPHRRSSAIEVQDRDSLRGVNTQFELAEVRFLAQKRLQKKRADEFALEFQNPSSTHIDDSVVFEGPVVIGPGVRILGESTIASGVVIEGQTLIENSKIHRNATIYWSSVLRDSTIGEEAEVGPMAHLRNQSDLRRKAVIGNFVEVKKSVVGEESKAKHLSYLGDAELGRAVNIGCGVITCNYDGVKKSKTIIHDGAFIGSDSQLLAPIEVGSKAYVASGTTLTKSIGDYALALSRGKQVVKENYAKKFLKDKK